MSDIREVIGRLEEATEGSRELDGDVAEAIGLYVVDRNRCRVTRGAISFPYNPRRPWTLDSECPSYTSSIDVALSLLPDDPTNEITGKADWQLSSINGGLTIFAKVGGAGKDEFGNTAPLALCIAALKARFPEAAP